MTQTTRPSWDTTAKYFSHVADKLGKRIDAGIFDTVVALNVLGITTRASCQGHLEWGLSYPWIDLEPEIEYKRRLHGYLVQFYADRPINFDSSLSWQGYRLRSNGGAFADLLDPEEREEKLYIYQAEMQAFTAFIKLEIQKNE